MPGAPAAQLMPALAYPLPRQFPITQRFGEVRLPTLRPHTGIDYGAPAGTLFLASAPGTAEVFYDPGGGTIVRVHVSPTFSYEGAHLLTPLVRTGQVVATGDRLGLTGSSGAFVTGPHLHFEVDVNGTAVDPAPYLGGAATVPGGAVGAPSGCAPPPGDYGDLFPVPREKVNCGCPQGYELAGIDPKLMIANPFGVGPYKTSWLGAQSMDELPQYKLPGPGFRMACRKAGVPDGNYYGYRLGQIAGDVAGAAGGAIFKFALPPLLEPAIAIAVMAVAGILVYKGATEILGFGPATQ